MEPVTQVWPEGPVLAPVVEALGGEGWHAIYRGERDTVVMLHELGLWTEFSGAWWFESGQPGHEVVVEALRAGVKAGVTGRIAIEVTKHEDGAVTSRLVRP